MKKLSFLLLVALIIGCGGGGGDNGGNHSPAISNLQYSPTSAAIDAGGGVINVSGTFDFTDGGGDVASIHIMTYDPAGSLTNDITNPITGVWGMKSGTVYGLLAIGTTIPGAYTFKVSILDSVGSSSNILSGTFNIGPTVYIPGYSISLVASGLGAATGVVIGPLGEIFLTDYQGGRILKINQITKAVEVHATSIMYPTDLAFDSIGRLMVTSSTGPSSNIIEVYANHTTGVFSSGYSYPVSIEAASDGSLFVGNGGNGTISQVNASGIYSTYLSGYSTSSGPGGLSIDEAGNLFFVDHATGKIYKAAPDKTVTLLATLTIFGPTFTEVDYTGNVYVSDSLNASIYRIAGGTVSLFASGFTGKSNPPVIGPGGLAFDGTGSLLVADGDYLWKISPN